MAVRDASSPIYGQRFVPLVIPVLVAFRTELFLFSVIGNAKFFQFVVIDFHDSSFTDGHFPLVHPIPCCFVPHCLIVRPRRRIVRYEHTAVGTFSGIGVTLFETVGIFRFRLLEVQHEFLESVATGCEIEAEILLDDGVYKLKDLLPKRWEH